MSPDRSEGKRSSLLFLLLFLFLFLGVSLRAEPVRVMSWNLRNYLVTDRVADGHFRRAYPKPESEKTPLRAAIVAAAPDVLAVQEIGDERFILELQRDLAGEGLELPHVAWVDGPDDERHLAILSRIPFTEVIPHAVLPFRYLRTDEVVKRGLLEVGFETGGTAWRLFVVHLKSRFSDREDDPDSTERRNGEATAIRDVIAQRLAADPGAAVFVVGDFNDHPASRPLRRFFAVNDRPLLEMVPVADDRGDNWTLHYAREDRYERIDFLLASPGARALLGARGGWIPDAPGLRVASDHRPIVFEWEVPTPGE